MKKLHKLKKQEHFTSQLLNRCFYNLGGTTDLALLAVQVELVLANSHGPDGLDEGGTGVPGMDSNATVTKRPSRYWRPTVGAETRPPYIHWIQIEALHLGITTRMMEHFSKNCSQIKIPFFAKPHTVLSFKHSNLAEQWTGLMTASFKNPNSLLHQAHLLYNSSLCTNICVLLKAHVW